MTTTPGVTQQVAHSMTGLKLENYYFLLLLFLDLKLENYSLITFLLFLFLDLKLENYSLFTVLLFLDLKLENYSVFTFFSTWIWKIIPYFDGLVQDCSDSIANSLELLHVE